MKFFKKVIIILGMTLLILTGVQQATAEHFLMPRTTLVHELKVRVGPATSFDIAYTVPQGTALEHLTVNGNWIEITSEDRIGFVSRYSVIPFEQEFNWVQGLVIDKIKIHRGGDNDRTLFLSVAEWCYVVATTEIYNVPIGKDGAITLREYINARGGMRFLTEEESLNCNFR